MGGGESGDGASGPPRGAEPSGCGERRCGRAELGVAAAGRGAAGGPLCSEPRAVGVPELGTGLGCTEVRAAAALVLLFRESFLTVLQISLGFLFLESQPGAPRPPSLTPPPPAPPHPKPPPRHRPRGGSVCRAAKCIAAVGGWRGGGVGRRGGSGAAPTGRAELEPLGTLFVAAARGPLPAPSPGADGDAPLPSGGDGFGLRLCDGCLRSV